MEFDLERWKEQLRDPLRRFSADPKGALKRAGAQTLFGYLAGMTLFPLAAASPRVSNTGGISPGAEAAARGNSVMPAR